MNSMNKRTFETGAFRDTSNHKLSYLRHLSPVVLRRYVTFLHKHRQMPDGSLREPDNWKLGMPKREWAESLLRHMWDFWAVSEGEDILRPETDSEPQNLQDLLCAIMFNAQGYLNELIKEEGETDRQPGPYVVAVEPTPWSKCPTCGHYKPCPHPHEAA